MLKCNINKKGRTVRLYSGLFDIFVAASVALMTFLDIFASWGYVAAVLLLLIGLFTIFEALKGWCVLRAMGIRTPF